MTLYTVFMYLTNITHNSHEPHSSRIWVFSHIFMRDLTRKYYRKYYPYYRWILTPSIFLECRPSTRVFITINQFILLQVISAQT